LNLITVNQGCFTCPGLSDSFPNDSHSVGIKFVDPFTEVLRAPRCRFSIASWISAKLIVKNRFNSSPNFLTVVPMPQVPAKTMMKEPDFA
jgi:hypothetical protein